MKDAPVGPWGGFGGGRSEIVLGMPPTPRPRILPIEQLNTEWRTLGRSARAVHALHHLAEHDADLAVLVHGPGSGSPASPPACPTPCDLIDHMRQATGSRGREEAAALIRLMLRQSPLDPLIVRCLIQALLPGLLTIAARLRWGQGGDWDDGSEFFSETLSTTWMVVSDWAGQDRPYAVLDLLSAIRCRMRRRLFRARDLRQQQLPLTSGVAEPRARTTETDLEVLARTLIELRREGMPAEDVEVLYAHHVLGFSIAELALFTGRDRRSLYARRDRGRRRLCA
jgi:DNA-directed RNA polymerase specialized sigma24 family protein